MPAESSGRAITSSIRPGRFEDELMSAPASQHHVFEVHQLAVDPERGAGVAEMRALDPARADRRAGEALVVPALMSESTSPPAIKFMND